MPISVSTQAAIFLYSVIGGMLIAFIYDLFRIKRRAIRTNNIIVNIEDFVYWIIVALVMFSVVYYSNEGEIRGYIFIGTAIGSILYMLLFSKLIINSSLAIIRLICKILKMVWFIITYPFRLILKILFVPVKFLGKLLKRGLRATKVIARDKMRKAMVLGRRLKKIRKKI